MAPSTNVYVDGIPRRVLDDRGAGALRDRAGKSLELSSLWGIGVHGLLGAVTGV